MFSGKSKCVNETLLKFGKQNGVTFMLEINATVILMLHALYLNVLSTKYQKKQLRHILKVT